MTYKKEWNIKHSFILELDTPMGKEMAQETQALLLAQTPIKELTLYSAPEKNHWFLYLKGDPTGAGMHKGYFSGVKYKGYKVLKQAGVSYKATKIKDEEPIFTKFKSLNVEFG